jgi:hypothetical protein
LGAVYHAEDIGQVISAVCPDVFIEATDASEPVFASLTGTASYGVVCLTGVSPVGRRVTEDAGAVMRAGHPLDEEDRRPWLEEIALGWPAMRTAEEW